MFDQGKSIHIVPLGNETPLTMPLIGSKAQGLVWLIQRGYQVPKGYVLSSAVMDEFLKIHQLEPAALISLSLGKGMAHIEELFLNLGMPGSLNAQLKGCFEEVSHGHPGSLAVRSSAMCEDLESASYAGQLYTALQVNTYEKMVESILKCWASLYHHQYLAYHRQLNGKQPLGGMGVIIQHMVLADVSGVLFTCDPIKNDLSVAIAEAHRGLATSVVEGQGGSDLFYYSLIEDELIKVIPASATPSLKTDEVLRLFRLAKKIHQQKGWPQDIEWSIQYDTHHQEGQIFFLQVRPVTTLSKNVSSKSFVNLYSSHLKTMKNAKEAS